MQVLARQLQTLSALSQSDLQGVLALPRRLKSERGAIHREGAPVSEIGVVIRGVVACRRSFSNGQRAIVSMHFAGGLLNLSAMHIKRTDVEVVALHQARVAFLPVAAVQVLHDRQSGVRDAMSRQSHVDYSILAEWTLGIGRRDALQRLAHLICEIYTRLKAVGIAYDNWFVFALTQSEIADATGLSVVHVNRTLKELRERGLIAQAGATYTILDWKNLCDVADFEPGYLHLLPG
jgi:CRP-like cAMP-binding protein